MNFKQKIIRRRQQPTYEKQPERSPFEKENNTSSWFQYYQTTCKTSQKREQGDFQRNSTQPQLVIAEERGNPRSQIIKKPRNNEQRSSQHYDQRTSQHFQVSMRNSKQPQEIINSKIQETKQEISEHLLILEKRLNKTLEEDRDLVQQYIEKQNIYIQKINDKVTKGNQDVHTSINEIVQQINKALDAQNKKIAKGQIKLKKIVEEVKEQIKGDMNSSLFDLQEKIQRIAVAGQGVKKSKAGDYSVDLKSSINDIGINNASQTSYEEIKIKQMMDSIKALKLQIMQVKTYSQTQPKELKSVPTSQSFYQNKSQVEKQISFLSQRIKGMQLEVDQQKANLQNKHSEYHKIVLIMEQNIRGMNDEFTKVINTQMIPRVKGVQEQVKVWHGKLDKKIQQNYNEKIQQKLALMKIIRIRKQKESERDKLGINGGLTYKQTYMLSEQGFLLDSSGTYLVDENNNKIKVEQQQIYYLKTQGIQIMN